MKEYSQLRFVPRRKSGSQKDCLKTSSKSQRHVNWLHVSRLLPLQFESEDHKPHASFYFGSISKIFPTLSEETKSGQVLVTRLPPYGLSLLHWKKRWEQSAKKSFCFLSRRRRESNWWGRSWKRRQSQTDSRSEAARNNMPLAAVAKATPQEMGEVSILTESSESSVAWFRRQGIRELG